MIFFEGELEQKSSCRIYDVSDFLSPGMSLPPSQKRNRSNSSPLNFTSPSLLPHIQYERVSLFPDGGIFDEPLFPPNGERERGKIGLTTIKMAHNSSSSHNNSNSNNSLCSSNNNGGDNNLLIISLVWPLLSGIRRRAGFARAL